MPTKYYTRVVIPATCGWEDCNLRPTTMIVPLANEADGYMVACGDHGAESEQMFIDIAVQVRQGILVNAIQRLEGDEVAYEDAIEEELATPEE